MDRRLDQGAPGGLVTLVSFLPEAILLIAITLVLCLLVAARKEWARIARWTLLIAALLALAASLYTMKAAGGRIFYGTYEIDLLSQAFKAILLFGLWIVVLLSESFSFVDAEKRIEYLLFLGTGTLGMMIIVSAVDMLSLFLGLELSSYSLYLLSALKKDRRSAEAGVKYFLFGAATSGIFLWGTSLLAGLSGTTNLIEIVQKIQTLSAEPAFVLSLAFVLFSFFFKFSAFPMHFWAPDVYESASTLVTTFIATASKAAAVAVFIRVLSLTGLEPFAIQTIGILAFLSMTWGNCVALLQSDAKRLLAYSSIAQAGYVLVGILSDSLEGFSSSFFYAAAYLLMNAGAFLVVLEVAKAHKNDNPQLGHFDGLAERSPFLALVLLLSLLSLAGIPPLAGFTGKWILFSAAMDKGHWFLVLWGVLNSVVSLFYYLTIVKHAYLEKPASSAPIVTSLPVRLFALGLVLSIILLGIFPNALIEFGQNAVLSIKQV